LEPGLLRAQAGYSTLTSLARAHRFKHRTCATFPDIYRIQRPPHHCIHYHLTCARSLNETPLSCHSHMTMCANLIHLGLPAISNTNATSVQRHRVLRCPFSKNQTSRRRQADLRSTIAYLLCARIHPLQQTAKSKTADQHTPTIKFVLREGDPGALRAC
jgi:hypothetical protein